jgi:hypothetical protein
MCSPEQVSGTTLASTTTLPSSPQPSIMPSVGASLLARHDF